MDLPEPENPQRRSRISLINLVAGGLIACLACLLIGPVALGQLGLRTQSVAAYLGSLEARGVPVPTLLPESHEPQSGLTVDIWFLPEPSYFGSEVIFTDQIVYGTTGDQQRAVYIVFSEEGMNQYLNYWSMWDAAETFLGEIDDPSVDFQLDSFIFHAGLTIGGQQHQIGILCRLDATATQFEFKGIEWGDSIVTAEDGSYLDGKAVLVVDLLNRALRELRFIDHDGTPLKLTHLYLETDHGEALATSTEP